MSTQTKIFEIMPQVIPASEKDERIKAALSKIREHLAECKRKYETGELYEYQRKKN